VLRVQESDHGSEISSRALSPSGDGTRDGGKGAGDKASAGLSMAPPGGWKTSSIDFGGGSAAAQRGLRRLPPSDASLGKEGSRTGALTMASHSSASSPWPRLRKSSKMEAPSPRQRLMSLWSSLRWSSNTCLLTRRKCRLHRKNGNKSVSAVPFSPVSAVAVASVAAAVARSPAARPVAAIAHSAVGGSRARCANRSLSAKAQHMAGPGNNPVQVLSTGLPLHWEFLRLRTGFELPSSWSALPCYGADLNRNSFCVMR
jgi:hypothetical protein